jgi:hypothetical protein
MGLGNHVNISLGDSPKPLDCSFEAQSQISSPRSEHVAENIPGKEQWRIGLVALRLHSTMFVVGSGSPICRTPNAQIAPAYDSCRAASG